MHTACMDSHWPDESARLCDLIVEAGAKVDATDSDGHTPLHFSCLNGLTEAAKVLVMNVFPQQTQSETIYNTSTLKDRIDPWPDHG